MKKIIIILILFLTSIGLAQSISTKDVVNSTDVALDSAGVFNPTSWRNVTGYASITLSIYSNLNSASSGVKIYWADKSISTGTYIIMDSVTTSYIAGTIFKLTLPVVSPYFKVKYTNTVTAQTSFNLTTMLYAVSGFITDIKGNILFEIKNSSGIELFTATNPALVSNIPGFRDTLITANIALGDSCTQTLNLGNRRLKTIYMPAAWDAANLTVRVSPDNVTWYNYYSDDVELVIVAGASYAINVNPRIFIGVQYIQLRSGTSAADVDQTAARTLKLKIGNY